MQQTSTRNNKKGKAATIFIILLCILIAGWVSMNIWREYQTAKNGKLVQLKVLNDRRVCIRKRKSVVVYNNGPVKIRLHGIKCRKDEFREGSYANFRISSNGLIVPAQNAYKPRLITTSLLLIGAIIALLITIKTYR